MLEYGFLEDQDYSLIKNVQGVSEDLNRVDYILKIDLQMFGVLSFEKLLHKTENGKRRPGLFINLKKKRAKDS
jgi:phage anti-repressor protein